MILDLDKMTIHELMNLYDRKFEQHLHLTREGQLHNALVLYRDVAKIRAEITERFVRKEI